jgi:Cell division septal protein
MILGRKSRKSKAADRPAEGFFSRRRRRMFLAAGGLVLAGGVAVAAIWGENSPFYGKVQTAVGDLRDHLAQGAGFQVKDILVVGRDATPRQALLDALDVGYGDAIIGVDLQTARERLLALPWVKSASVERVLPDTLIIRLSERRPVALWQQQRGQYAVIDREGNILDNDTAGSFTDLLVVAGNEAPAHVGALLSMLRTEPKLMEHVESAMWVGGRRWTVFLDNGICIRLPEEEPGDAWRRLAAYDRMHALLSKNIRAIDMRLADKLIVQSKAGQDAAPEGDKPGASPVAPPSGRTPSRKVTPGRSAQGRISRRRGRRVVRNQQV